MGICPIDDKECACVKYCNGYFKDGIDDNLPRDGARFRTFTNVKPVIVDDGAGMSILTTAERVRGHKRNVGPK